MHVKITMNSIELRQLLAVDFNTRFIYGKVLALDELLFWPDFMKQSYIVVNNQPQYLKGEHWLAIFFPNKQTDPVEVFDSLGHPPDSYGKELVNFLKRERSSYSFNLNPVQSQDSVLCGLFCVYFISKRCLGKTFNEIMQDFNPNDPQNNEAVILKYISGNH